MKSIAFVTPKRIFENEEETPVNMWYEREGWRAFVLQGDIEYLRAHMARFYAERPHMKQELMKLLWCAVSSRHDELYGVVVYVGDNGSECVFDFVRDMRAMETDNGLVPLPVLFLVCPCHEDAHRASVRERGLTFTRILPADPGGFAVMRSLFENYMSRGSLPGLDELRMFAWKAG